MIHIFMAKDPETGRIFAQRREWDDTSFPKGARGAGWLMRVTQVEDEEWESCLRGSSAGMGPVAQDIVHQQWWERGE
jgi:hypothetical protein